MIRKTRFFFCCLYALGSFAGEGEVLPHTVKKGESVSLICIDYYGYYSSALGKAVRRGNPEIRDINLVFPGQTLRLRMPRAGAAREVAPEDSLFVRKVAAQQGVVTCVVGGASLRRRGAEKETVLSVNTIVAPGDRITTSANGRVEIIINRETVVRLREKTVLVLENFRNVSTGKGRTRVGFPGGTLWTKMKRFQDRISRFEMELPTAIAGVHGTVCQAAVGSDSSAEVRVFSGEVAVRGRGGGRAGARKPSSEDRHEVPGPAEVEGPTEVDLDTWVRIVGAMQKVTIDKRGSPSAPKKFTADTTSEWEQWNRERDRRINDLFREK